MKKTKPNKIEVIVRVDGEQVCNFECDNYKLTMRRDIKHRHTGDENYPTIAMIGSEGLLIKAWRRDFDFPIELFTDDEDFYKRMGINIEK